MQEVLRHAGSWSAETSAKAATEIDEAEYQRIVRLAARIAGVQEAQDIAHKTFLIALKSLPTFRRKAKFSTWLTRIAINVAISARRRRAKRLALFPESNAGYDHVSGAASSLGNPREEAEVNEKRRLLETTVASLPSKLLVPFALRYYEGMTCREVARVLGHREGTVRYRVFKARQLLKMKLERLLR